MTWTAHYFDPRSNREGVSRAFSPHEDAMRQACFLMRQTCVVHFVEGPNGERSTLWRSQHGARSTRYAEPPQCRAPIQQVVSPPSGRAPSVLLLAGFSCSSAPTAPIENETPKMALGDRARKWRDKFRTRRQGHICERPRYRAVWKSIHMSARGRRLAGWAGRIRTPHENRLPCSILYGAIRLPISPAI
jgi:hypothetical protein